MRDAWGWSGVLMVMSKLEQVKLECIASIRRDCAEARNHLGITLGHFGRGIQRDTISCLSQSCLSESPRVVGPLPLMRESATHQSPISLSKEE